MSDYLFVYGTLMRGYCRHHHMNTACFLGEVVTEPHYRLFDLGEYPGLVHATPGEAIHGELYEIPSSLWPTLDDVEGVQLGLYHREPVRLSKTSTIRLPNEPVQTYIYLQPVQGLDRCGLRWL